MKIVQGEGGGFGSKEKNKRGEEKSYRSEHKVYKLKGATTVLVGETSKQKVSVRQRKWKDALYF